MLYGIKLNICRNLYTYINIIIYIYVCYIIWNFVCLLARETKKFANTMQYINSFEISFRWHGKYEEAP